jgi:tRNA threonylcarbamoyl adenosine modification protein YjeE
MLKKKSLVWQNCSEAELGTHVSAWLKDTNLSNSLIFLEGDMGAGKSTFVREILKGVSPQSLSQGSPTFPIVQMYLTENQRPFYHVDLYRIKDSAELEDSGIEAQLEEENTTACIEWASLFANQFAHWFTQKVLTRKKNVFLVTIEPASEDLRNYTIQTF